MAQKTSSVDGDEKVIIKKYANRRLYNTRSSSYITLEDLAEMTREDVDFQVIDAKSGEDITHSVLTQIIVDEESHGQNMLPVAFLRQIISLYGGALQPMVPQYLEASMEAFRKNQREFHKALEDAVTAGPFGEIARRNIEMMKAAGEAFVPKDTSEAASADADETAEGGEGDKQDISELRKQLASLQAKLDKLED